MTLPLSRSTDYVDDQLPAIAAADLNDIQGYTADYYHKLSGPDLVVSDDFISDGLNRGIWIAPTAGVTIDSDTSGSGIGVCRLLVAGSTSKPTIKTAPLNIGTKSLHVISALQLTSFTRTTATILAGITDGSGNGLWFQADSHANWIARYSGDGGTGIDTGVASTASSSTFGIFEITRIGSTASWFINGVQVATASVAGSLTVPLMFQSADGTFSSELSVDFVKLWISRLGSNTTAVPAT